jgi:RNA polymerase sigma-70 factor (sigma-E family)
LKLVDRSRDDEFRDFVAGSSRRLLRISVAMTGDRHSAEDLVQDVLAKLSVSWRRVDDPMAYCRRALVNSNINRWRVRQRRPEVSLAEWHDRATGDVLSDWDDRDLLVRALGELPAGQRSVLVLRFLEDMSETETAEALGCSLGTVKSQTSRALSRLRHRFAALQSTATNEDVR